MAKDDCESLPRIPDDDEAPTNAFFTSTNCCCFRLPCFPSHLSAPSSSAGRIASVSSAASPSLCDRIRAGESERKWWSTPFRALKKLREWSEIVAGPKWKTFIRRFNRSKGGACVGGGGYKPGNFQYDPLSYALNFDEGAAQICVADEDHGYYPDFASRYVSGPLSSKSSADLVGAVAAAG